MMDRFTHNIHQIHKPKIAQVPIGHALKMVADFKLATANGAVIGKAGDYIIKEEDGMISVISELAFKERYKFLQ
ncbi:MAG: hypothetical protein U9N13_00665 [Euryarchaeota archaeon]|nr:hypothetical protein [Euryarchaeota archaeon]